MLVKALVVLRSSVAFGKFVFLIHKSYLEGRGETILYKNKTNFKSIFLHYRNVATGVYRLFPCTLESCRRTELQINFSKSFIIYDNQNTDLHALKKLKIVWITNQKIFKYKLAVLAIFLKIWTYPKYMRLYGYIFWIFSISINASQLDELKILITEIELQRRLKNSEHLIVYNLTKKKNKDVS